MFSGEAAVEGQDRNGRMLRHTRALTLLAQRLWHSGDGLQSALTAITEAAAQVLDVEGVGVWQYESGGGKHCIHVYRQSEHLHHGADFEENVVAADSSRQHPLPQTLMIQAAETESPSTRPVMPPPHQHRERSRLDTQIRIDGELYGAILYDDIDPVRVWRPDEIAFARKMADFVVQALQVERRRRAEVKLDYLELHDPVSGLGNRTMLLGAIEDLLRRQRLQPRIAALLFISIDRFYSINEIAAEAGGDKVLTELGARISGAVPDEADIARVESDCFAVLLPRLTDEWQAVRRAEDILAVLNEPLRLEQTELSVSASMGITFNRANSHTTANALLRDADLASKQASQLGRNRCAVFNVQQHRDLLARLAIERSLREALDSDALVAVYQPQIDLTDGRVVGAEALLRWRDGAGELRVAGDFIAIAESSGLIIAIGRWILHRACSDAKLWPLPREGRACDLAVNLSARQFEQPGLLEMVAEVLRETAFDPHRLCLEITEETLMSRADSALETLHALKALGVSLAVDDFGTGYSSLAYLKRFPIDFLKIDKSLIDGLPQDLQSHAIVTAVLALSKAMGLEVIVEGVERSVQEAALREMGCLRTQGWLYARGEPNENFIARLRAQG